MRRGVHAHTNAHANVQKRTAVLYAHNVNFIRGFAFSGCEPAFNTPDGKRRRKRDTVGAAAPSAAVNPGQQGE